MMENENKNVDKIIERLENGVREIFEGDNYKHYLEVMAKFHTFSSYNWQLIYEQCPKATKLAGYVQWQKDFNRHVKNGEKAIRILAPRFGKGGMRGFKEVCIFDISQTEGEPLPKTGIEVRVLQGSYDYYDTLFSALEEISPLPIEFGKLASGVRGTCYFGKKIVISIGMSQIQNTETLIHEIAHELLHNGSDKDRNTREVEAESVAYAVCSYFNLDTSDYSFGYVAGWSEDKQLDILRSSLETITKTSNKFISDILEHLGEYNEDIDFDEEDDEQRGEELYELGMARYYNGDYNIAIEYLEQAANLGNQEAMMKIANCYYNGVGVEYNVYEAYKWFEKLASLDNDYACYILGKICSYFIEEPDYKEAVYWYEKAAELEYISAYYQLGHCYEYGLGVEADRETAQEYYLEAALAGYENAREAVDSDFVYQKGYALYWKSKYKEAIKYLQLATELEHIEANDLLGDCYYWGRGVEVDYGASYDYYLFSAENGYASAQYHVGNAFQYGKGVTKNIEEAVHWYKKSAEQDCKEGQFVLAECYWYGIGVDENKEIAVQYYLQSYSDGDVYTGQKLIECYYDGMNVDEHTIKNFINDWVDIDEEDNDEFLFILGEMYFAGNLVEQDYTKAVKCFEKAKEGCEYHMCYHLAECYFYGLGVERNLESAIENYQLGAYNENVYQEKAFNKMYDLLLQGYWNDKIEEDLLYNITDDAENGNEKAQLMLANCYYNGYGVDINYTEALSWREKAAEAGNAQAQFLVAQQYFSGIGTLRDIAQAKHWYTVAAENGNIEAQYELAKLLEVGSEGVIKNLPGAFYWYKKAAEADCLDAMVKVGQMYDLGIGISKNVDKAAFWYEKAVARNSIEAIFCLANIYLYVQRDIEKCIAMYEKVIEATTNDKLKALVMTKMGEFYDLGLGVKRNSYKAMYYYRDAVAKGSKDAAYLLGKIYLQQKEYGAPKRAIQFLMLGADEGHIGCQKLLADMYLNGTVVQQNKATAIKWYAEAAKNGDIESEIKMLELMHENVGIKEEPEEVSEKKSEKDISDIADKLFGIFS